MYLWGIAGERIYCPLWQGPFSDKRLYCDLGIILWISLSCTDFLSWLFYFISFACAAFASRPSNLNLICLVALENLTNTFWLQKHVDDVFELERTEKNANCGGASLSPFLPRSSQFCCLLVVPFLLTTVVMHWKREPKSHYISLAVAVAAESHYSSLTVSKRAAELVFAEHPLPPPHHAPLAGNCLILQQAGGETAATPVHVSLSWVGVCFGVTHKCCLGSSRGAPPEGGEARQRHISSALQSWQSSSVDAVWMGPG